MIIVGLPYAFPGLTNMDEITGGSPYGASTLAKGDGSRQPSANELDGARYQGKRVARSQRSWRAINKRRALLQWLGQDVYSPE